MSNDHPKPVTAQKLSAERLAAIRRWVEDGRDYGTATARDLLAEVDRLRAEAEAARPKAKPNDVPAHAEGKVRIVEEAVDFARRFGASETVLAALAQRHDVGMARYGLPLTEATPIDAHAYLVEEVLDTVVYATLIWARGEIGGQTANRVRIVALHALKLLLDERDEVTP